MLQSVWSYIGWGVYLTRPVLASVSSFGESLLHAECWFRIVVRRMGSLYYMPRAGICLVHSAVICLVVHWEWRLYYTALDGICLVLGRWGVSLTRPVVKPVWSYVGWGVHPTHPVLAAVFSFDCWGVSIARPRPGMCLVEKWLGSFSYTPRAAICLIV